MARAFSILFFAIVILFLTVPGKLAGQNLVPNPGFEELINCPDQNGAIDFGTSYWYSDFGTPDYFNTCVKVPFDPNGNYINSRNVPSNYLSYQPAASGNAYAGIVCHSFQHSIKNWREYLIAPLLQPLKTGHSYEVSYKMNLASWQRMVEYEHGCNKNGVLFNFGKISNIPNFAHLVNNDIITDTLNWTSVTGTFVADTNYTHIALGNFFDDSYVSIHQLKKSNNSSTAYYFYDDVSVIEIPKIYTRDTSVCTGDSAVLKAIYSGNFYWSLHEDGHDTLSLAAELTVKPQHTTTYYLLTETRREKITVNVYPPPSVDLGKDTSVCPEIFFLNAYTPGATYLWNTGNKNPQQETLTTGLYYVTVSIGSCQATDSIYITLKDDAICNNGILRLYPNPFSDYLFLKGEFGRKTPLSIRVFDVLGRDLGGLDETLVSGEFKYQLELFWLKPAMYFVSVKNGDEIHVYKVIKI